jgi:hypothetical protein
MKTAMKVPSITKAGPVVVQVYSYGEKMPSKSLSS